MPETFPEILHEFRNEIAILERTPQFVLKNQTCADMAREYKIIAGWIEAAWKAEAAEIVQIIQVAIASYESAYPDAPNDDAEFYIKHQIDVANDWLAAHGFARINVKLDKEEEPW